MKLLQYAKFIEEQLKSAKASNKASNKASSKASS